MKPHLMTACIVFIVFGGVLFTHNRVFLSDERVRTSQTAESMSVSSPFVAAPGRIEGRTRTIELRPGLAERIVDIAVEEGSRVRVGDLIVRLDAQKLDAELQMAHAELRRARSKFERLVNGARDSEIASLKAEYEAALADFRGAEQEYDRTAKLDAKNAASQQTLDRQITRLKRAAAEVAASRARLSTIEAPPRVDELAEATAAVESARAKVKLAEVMLGKTELRSPANGLILEINGEVGEMTLPDQAEPLVSVADTSILQARAEIDEYDVMRIRTGQTALVSASGWGQQSLTGTVTSVSPNVHPQSLFNDRPGERFDSYRLDVLILLEDPPKLPVGLPVDVRIEIDPG